MQGKEAFSFLYNKKPPIRRLKVFGGHHVEIVKLLYEELSNKIEFLKAISVMMERQSPKTLQATNILYSK